METCSGAELMELRFSPEYYNEWGSAFGRMQLRLNLSTVTTFPGCNEEIHETRQPE
jgi:hypothetical protein